MANSESHGAQKERMGSWEVFRTSQKALRPNQYFPSAFIEATGNFFFYTDILTCRQLQDAFTSTFVLTQFFFV